MTSSQAVAADLSRLRHNLRIAAADVRRAPHPSARKLALRRCDILLDRWLALTRLPS